MTPTPTPHPHLTPTLETFIQHWLPMVLSTMPGTDADQLRDSALIIIDSLRPRDTIDTLFSGVFVASLFGGLESLRQSMLPGLPEPLACRLRTIGFSGLRTAVALVGKLREDRPGAPTVFLPAMADMAALLQAGGAPSFSPMSQQPPRATASARATATRTTPGRTQTAVPTPPVRKPGRPQTTARRSPAPIQPHCPACPRATTRG